MGQKFSPYPRGNRRSGQVYVALLSTGVVKVGVTTLPLKRRLFNLKNVLAVHGVSIARVHYSPVHDEPRRTEELLIEYGNLHGVPTTQGSKREWFTRLTYESVVDFANTLVFTEDAGLSSMKELDVPSQLGYIEHDLYSGRVPLPIFS